MRCKAAKEAIFQDGLGLLAEPSRDRLRQHCTECSSCDAALRASTALDRRFLALRSQPVPPVDISRQVLARIPVEPPAGTKVAAWTLAAALGASLGFIVMTIVLLPHALPLLRAGLDGTAAVIRSAAPLLTLGTALFQVGSLLSRPLISLGTAFGAAQPLAWTVLITGGSIAVAMSLVIVGRAFLLPETAGSRKES